MMRNVMIRLHELSRESNEHLGRSAVCVGPRFKMLPNILSVSAAYRTTRVLDDNLYPWLRSMTARIPKKAMWNMQSSFSDLLPKTMRFKTALLDKPRSGAYRAAENAGVFHVLQSAELHRLAEAMMRRSLDRSPTCQVICYGPGDYSGPHTDHHPDVPHLRNGYVDVHVMFSNSAVADQLLVVEDEGLLTNAVPIGIPSGIAFYNLPFWHYTTPLQERRGAHGARRWLLLASYYLCRPGQNL